MPHGAMSLESSSTTSKTSISESLCQETQSDIRLCQQESSLRPCHWRLVSRSHHTTPGNTHTQHHATHKHTQHHARHGRHHLHGEPRMPGATILPGTTRDHTRLHARTINIMDVTCARHHHHHHHHHHARRPFCMMSRWQPSRTRQGHRHHETEVVTARDHTTTETCTTR